MRTRRGNYPSPSDGITFSIKPSVQKRRLPSGTSHRPAKAARAPCFFDSLHDDVLITIITAVSSTASSPADLVNTMLTCRRFCAAATNPHVLANASTAALAVKASSWSDGSSRFLKQCADAGNIEACYTLGMIRFYCLHNRGGGASLMAKAAMASHAAALHSLAVIQFNGSGGSRKDKDLKAGVALCARAASLGHVDAMRELGHCLQDGYGVAQNVVKGRGLLLEANTREAAAAVAQSPRRFMEAALHLTAKGGAMACLHHHLHYYAVLGKGALAKSSSSSPLLQQSQDHHHHHHHHQQQSERTQLHQHHHQQHQRSMLLSPITSNSGGGLSCSSPPSTPAAAATVSAIECHPVYTLLQSGGCSLLSDFGCNVPPPKLHVANRFMVDWFVAKPPESGLRLCSHSNCGRPESRRHEFRRCSACGSVNYCSRACQALDWKIRHKCDCTPVPDWEDREENGGGGGAGGGGGGERGDEEDDDEEQRQGFDEMEES
ncbi:F-box protein At1g67340 [Selaginella moellendorffii]|uniref:F-box protein At1g67340 n=1 Tax=Selaginella moellendorffii TaxID=88036 RepID=UPI000D1C84E2|nr:F-box protein At1g67340 [Selaginella moellendorffii]|eukprot:XP_024530639.1 F-box protein At1g67340 [Selaginella moellendorffii]